MRAFHSRLLVVCFALVLAGALAWAVLEKAAAGFLPPYRALSKLDWPAGLLFVIVLLVAAFSRRVSDRMKPGRGRG